MVSSRKWPHGRKSLAVCLAVIAGYVDAYGFITFGTFVSFMSGNTTHAGSDIGGGFLKAAIPAVLAIISFVAGVFAATLLVRSGMRRPRFALYIIIAALLGLTIAVTRLTVLSAPAFVIMLSFTMGVMNTALSRVGSQLVNVTFVTGTLSQIGGHLARAWRSEPLEDAEWPGDTHFARAMLLTTVWLGFFSGALLGGALTLLMGVWMLAIPAVTILFLASAETLITNVSD